MPLRLLSTRIVGGFHSDHKALVADYQIGTPEARMVTPEIVSMIRRTEPNNWTATEYDKFFICIHATVSHEVNAGARLVAGWFNDPDFDASTQYVVDNREIIQSVPDKAYAWAAGTTANKYGIHIELVAMPGQTRSEWADEYSEAELRLAASLVRAKCAEFKIPTRKIGPADLRARRGGIAGHDDVRDAWGETTHWDPGPNFPWERFLRMVNESEEDEMNEADKKFVAAEISKNARWTVEKLRASQVDVNRLAAAVAAAVKPSVDIDEGKLAAEIIRQLGA